jgi:threonyl-tRNA synthetase
VGRDSGYGIGSVDKADSVSIYTTGKFIDLCRGGHVSNTSEIDPKSFKLDKISGAYWRGDQDNEQLQRIYGLAFEDETSLNQFLKMREEAEKRDHKKLGRELKLFTISDLVGAGLPLIQPKGMIIRKEIEDYLWELHQDKGYSRVWTPHIAKEELYETSGHAAKFGDELFRVQGKDDKFIMKPMNCPHHMQIYVDNQFSYRDMPVRYFEPTTVYRDEKSGQLGGLTRVRSITQDDGHLFCRTSQIGQEVSTIVNVIKEFYASFGMLDEYWVSLSVRGEDKSKYLGEDDAWETAEKSLEDAAKENKLNYKRMEGEAAFYGPKLDFMFKDSIGREWQLATIQCDFNLPERFGLSYTNEKGEEERPVVIHRAISGSLERFMGILIEHYAGAFPLWLAPVQLAVLPISDKHLEYAQSIVQELKDNGMRVNLDDRSESIGKKIREATTQKVPYMLIIGDKEIDSNGASVRTLGGEDLGTMPLADLVQKMTQEITNKQ